MKTQIHTDHGPDAQRSGPSRRVVLRTGAWTVPAIAVASTAPAFAASTGAITGTHQVVRTSATTIQSSGTVTNGTGAVQTVTLTWNWLCASTGPGAGSFYAGDNPNVNGWTSSNYQYVAAGASGTRGIRLVTSRQVAVGATVSLPTLTLYLSPAATTGTLTAAFSVTTAATVVQPPQTSWTAFTGVAPRTAAGRSSAPAKDFVSPAS